MKLKFYLTLLLLFAVGKASAYDFEADGIYYNINGNEAAVTFIGYTSGNNTVITDHYSGNIIIPERVTYNGVTYPVTAIERRAFSNCSNPLTVTIPKSVTAIANFSFSASSGITSITIDKDNPRYDSRDNCNAVIRTADNVLIAGCKNTIIPNTVAAIGNGAFWGCNGLQNLTIPNSVTSIAVQGFAYCRDLKSVDIGNSVTFIDEDAFGTCISLKNVTIPKSVNFLAKGAFQNCLALTDVYSYITDLTQVISRDRIFYVSSANGDYDYSGRTLHVPPGTADAYRADEHWAPYFGQIVDDLLPDHKRGDVNLDGEVNIADVNALIDIIFEGNGNTMAADVNGDGEINIADINAVIDIIMGASTPVPDNHEYVDLGLPSGTLWATMNVGANAPEEYGNYFAWGETEPKWDYKWVTYKWCNGTENTITKYCTNSDYGTVDNKTELDAEDDAAYVNWGPLWRMPTNEQQDELQTYCTWMRTTRNGVDGCLVIGPNENTIFFPASGYRNSVYLIDASSSGCCWSRTLYSDDPSDAYRLGFNSRGVYGGSIIRYDGFNVRAVRVREGLYIKQLSLNLGEVGIGKTRTGELTIVNSTTRNQTLTVTADEPFLFKVNDGSASSININVPSNSTKSVTVMFTATELGEFNGNVTFENPALDGGMSVVTVHATAISNDEWVDLGLPSGTLWATCNVGATRPEEYGDYFAWGEIEPKEDYTWATYKWCDGTYDSLTKYCTNSEFGIVDNKAYLDPKDDAARMNLGQEWQIPSRMQLQELCSSCTSMLTQKNGVKGRLYTGPNGNSIFFPAAGYYYQKTLHEEGTVGDYWSRELYMMNRPHVAAGFRLSSIWGYFSDSRSYGLTVRAVRTSTADFYVEEQNLDLGVVPLSETSTGVLTIVNNTMDAMPLAVTVEEPFLLKQGEDSVSSMNIVVPAGVNFPLVVLFNGTTQGPFDGNVTIRKPASDAGQVTIPVHVLAYSYPNAQQDYVDLGLPSGTLWASCNVGASSPGEYGNYFAWGETAPKEVYTWGTYKWCNGTDNTLTKYCTNSDFGTVDNKAELEHEDDAAFVNMGPSWRTPKIEQLKELENNCTWKWTTLNGVKGYMVIGSNGSSMFLPQPGCRENDQSYDQESTGYYWSREISSYDYPSGAYCRDFGTLVGSARYIGYSVRAVRMSPDDVFVEQQRLDIDGVVVGETCTGELTLVNNTMEPITMTATVDAPFSFKRAGGYTSSMPIVVPSKSIAQVTVVFASTTPGQFDGNVTFQSPALHGGQRVIPIHAVAFTADLLHQEYVDLGLLSGTLWATRDVGANSPEEYGDEFIWGHTTPLNNGKASINKSSKESEDSISKCSMNSRRGLIDYLPEPGPDFGTGSDAAYVNWGPEWRTPSMLQIVELIESCTCYRARLNGVMGRLVTGPNGNTIFWPADGYYWSRTSLRSSDSVFGLHLESRGMNWAVFWGPRGWGSRVRPVRLSQD